MSPATPDNAHPTDEAGPVRDDSPRPATADPDPSDTPDPDRSVAGPGDPVAGPGDPVAGPGDPVAAPPAPSTGTGDPTAAPTTVPVGEAPVPQVNGYLPGYAEPLPVRRAPWRTLAAGVAAVLVLALLGAPLGLLWRSVAPSVPVIQADGGAVLAQPQPEEFVAADGWFSLFGLIFGLLAAIGVWLFLRRYRGPIGMVVAVLGSIGAAVVAWQVGRQIGLAEYHRLLETAAAGTTFSKPPDLRAGQFEWVFGFVPTLRGDLLLPAFGSVVMYTMLAGWSRYAGLGVEPEPVGVSWDSVALPAQPPAPAPPAPDAAEPPRD